MNSDKAPRFGIMACESSGQPPFAEREFYRHLCRLGRSLGLETYVFSPARLDPDTRLVKGYTYVSEAAGWVEKDFPLPDLIYDRSFPGKSGYSDHRRAVLKLTSIKQVPFLGRPLKGKWDVFRTLQREPELRPYLPRTERLTSGNQLAGWLKERGQVFLKPVNGSHGKGTAYVAAQGSGYRVRARSSSNRPLDRSFTSIHCLLQWVSRFKGVRAYLIQDYLTLTDSEGGVFDIRSLVQKNGQGLWELTGMAVRKGGSGSITSNLHGGGSADRVRPFLEKEFGSDKALSIEKTLHFLSDKIPPVLEAASGRMAELGLDLGVDRDGKVWVIEVNSKPGRSVFHRLCERNAQMSSIRNPVAYAGHLLRRSRTDPLLPGRSPSNLRQNL